MKNKSDNFVFLCDSCKTLKENDEASGLKDQVKELKEAIQLLTSEFRAFKEEKSSEPLQNAAKKMVNMLMLLKVCLVTLSALNLMGRRWIWKILKK